MSHPLSHATRGAYATSLTPFERAKTLFDAAFYAISNADVLANGIDPYEHFMTYGWREGRNPSATFNTLYYKDRYLSYVNVQNPLLHAASLATPPQAVPSNEGEFLDIQCGVVAPFFNDLFYLADTTFFSTEIALRHYLQQGWREGREPNAGFSSALYLTGAPYVRSLDICPFYHLASTNPEAAKACFETEVDHEPSKPTTEYHVIQTIRQEFDSDFYLQANADVKNSAHNPLLHFVRFGWKEGRNPCRSFNVRYYISENDDVRQSKMNPFYHYIKDGRREGRGAISGEGQTRALFDIGFYLETYPDVAEANVDAYEHYMSFGWKEGRNPSTNFNTLFFKHFNSVSDGCNPFIRFAEGADHSSGVAVTEEQHVSLQMAITAPFFDASFYERSYELGNSTDPLRHYITQGWRIGHEPNGYFSTPEYVRGRPYVEALGVCALYHCASVDPDLATLLSSAANLSKDLSVGAGPTVVCDAEDAVIQAIKAEFDAAYYLKRNGDVKDAGHMAIIHFVRYGWREGRDPNRLFDTRFYLAANEEVRSAGINPFLHYLTRGRSEGRLPNPVGGSLWPATEAPADADWSKAMPADDLGQAQIAIIMPVYSGFADTLAAIYSVLTNTQKTAFALIVINDCSPDLGLTTALRALARKGLFIYRENETNLGFVKTINRSIGLCQHDIVLLNADVIVFNDWLDRLLWHAQKDSTVATVTPTSNNASICSYPLFDCNNAIALETDRCSLDNLSSICNNKSSIEIPTGVGFCMYMRRSVVNEIGSFDELAFGRGYGEENDFCMRALKQGYKNLLAQDIYVYHAGEVSFGAFHTQEFEPGQQALRSKHPDYLGRCRRFIEADPGHEGRLRLDLIRLAHALNRRAFVFVTHSFEGGVSTHVDDMAARLNSEGSPVILIKVGIEGGAAVSIVIKGIAHFYMPSLTEIRLPKFADLLREFLIWLEPRLVHVHSFVGMNWQATRSLAEAIKLSKQPYAYTLHDYSSVCHRNHLIRPDATYCGLPSVNVCKKCVMIDREFREYVDPYSRRRFYGQFLSGAKMVIAPSLDIKSRVEKVFKNLDARVRHHDEKPRSVVRPQQPTGSKPLRVAIIGAIGPNKGSGLIHAMALDASTRGLDLEISIIGFSDMTDSLAQLGVVETGRYDSDVVVFEKMMHIQPHIVFFSSVWPETYSYTLSLALASGVPPVVLDVGAPAERLRRHKLGHILPLDLLQYPQLLNDALLQIPLDELWAKSRQADLGTYLSVHKDYYEIETQ